MPKVMQFSMQRSIVWWKSAFSMLLWENKKEYSTENSQEIEENIPKLWKQ